MTEVFLSKNGSLSVNGRKPFRQRTNVLPSKNGCPSVKRRMSFRTRRKYTSKNGSLSVKVQESFCQRTEVCPLKERTLSVKRRKCFRCRTKISFKEWKSCHQRTEVFRSKSNRQRTEVVPTTDGSLSEKKGFLKKTKVSLLIKEYNKPFLSMNVNFSIKVRKYFNQKLRKYELFHRGQKPFTLLISFTVSNDKSNFRNENHTVKGRKSSRHRTEGFGWRTEVFPLINESLSIKQKKNFRSFYLKNGSLSMKGRKS